MIGKNRSTNVRFLVVVFGGVALLLLSCGTIAGAESTLLDLDDNTALTEKSTWDTYENEGVATADVAAPDLEITVAKEHDDVDVDGFHNDFSYEYLRVDYNEQIDRKIRFYIPSSYWSPYYDSNVESIDGDVTANFQPVAEGKYTAVTIDFDGETSAVFKASQARGKTWSFWSEQDDKVENVTGVSAGVSGEDQWNYAQNDEWSNGTLVVSNVSNPDRVLIQYDAAVGDEEPVWLKVTEGESSRSSVYYFVRDSSSSSNNTNTTIVVVSKESEPPAVRIKKSESAGDGIGSILNDWSEIPNRWDRFTSSLFGSGKK